MTPNKAIDWQPWHNEKERFAQTIEIGFSAQMRALEQHIKKLREICPKDKADFPHNTALFYLNKLQMQLNNAYLFTQ